MKTATDPFAGTNVEPVSAGRNAAVLAAGGYTQDLAYVTSSLIISATAAGSLVLLMANELNDANTITFPIAAGTYQLSMQVRRVVTVPASCTVVAMFSQG